MIEGVVARPGERDSARSTDAANFFVAALDPFERGAGLRPLVEHNRPHGAHRAMETGEEDPPEIGYARRHPAATLG